MPEGYALSNEEAEKNIVKFFCNGGYVCIYVAKS